MKQGNLWCITFWFHVSRINFTKHKYLPKKKNSIQLSDILRTHKSMLKHFVSNYNTCDLSRRWIRWIILCPNGQDCLSANSCICIFYFTSRWLWYLLSIETNAIDGLNKCCRRTKQILNNLAVVLFSKH